MRTEEKLNMTMLCDFYELTMGNGYFQTGYKGRIVYFDVFFRKVPDGGGYAITAGLEQLIDYIENLHFTEADIAYLRGRGIFCEEFLEYLRDFHFTGDIYAIPEGTPVFPKEPLVVVRAPAIEAQLIETFTLLTINHQSLIATKANRNHGGEQPRNQLCPHGHLRLVVVRPDVDCAHGIGRGLSPETPCAPLGHLDAAWIDGRHPCGRTAHPPHRHQGQDAPA